MKKLTEKEKIKQKEWSKYTLEHKWYAQRKAIKDDEKEDFTPHKACIFCEKTPILEFVTYANEEYKLYECKKCLCPKGICVNYIISYIEKLSDMGSSNQDYMLNHWKEDDWDKALEYTEAIIRLFEANIKE